MLALNKLRQIVIQYLYKEDFLKEKDFSSFLKENGFSLSREDLAWMNERIEKINENIDEIDSLIKSHTDNWDFNRLGFVEKEILRLSTTELLFFPEVPLAVAIDEAIKLAKNYCGYKSFSLINGILDAIAGEKLKH